MLRAELMLRATKTCHLLAVCWCVCVSVSVCLSLAHTLVHLLLSALSWAGLLFYANIVKI